MSDISNQLYDAVDNILSTFIQSSGSEPTSNIKKSLDGRAADEALGSLNVIMSRAIPRTTSEARGKRQ